MQREHVGETVGQLVGGCTQGRALDAVVRPWGEGGGGRRDDSSMSTYQEAKGLDLGEALVL